MKTTRILTALLAVTALVGVTLPATASWTCPPGTTAGSLDEDGNPTSCTNTAADPEVVVETVAASGDSIVAWEDRSGGDVSAGSWTTYMADDDLQFTHEGWAKGGAKLAEISANTKPVKAGTFVIMAGANDLGDRWGTPTATMRAQLLDIAAKSHSPNIVLAASPPLTFNPQWSNFWNMQLRDMATIYGWTYVNPWVEPYADVYGNWKPGASADGVHPTQATAVLVGELMHDKVLATR